MKALGNSLFQGRRAGACLALLLGLATTLPSLGEDDGIDITDQQGRSFKGTPIHLSETHLEVRRASDGKIFSLERTRLSEKTVEAADEWLAVAEGKEHMKENVRLSEIRAKLQAFPVDCKFGKVTVYTGIKDCVADLQGGGGGVVLTAPDRSKFVSDEIGRYGVKDRETMRAHMDKLVERKMQGSNAEFRREFMKDLEIVEVEIGGWTGLEVKPGWKVGSIRCCCLERDGRFFEFHHLAPMTAREHTRKSEIDRLDVDSEEWERLIDTFHIE